LSYLLTAHLRECLHNQQSTLAVTAVLTSCRLGWLGNSATLGNKTKGMCRLVSKTRQKAENFVVAVSVVVIFRKPATKEIHCPALRPIKQDLNMGL